MNLEKSVAGLLNVPHEATFTYCQESPQKVSRNDMSQILEVLFYMMGSFTMASTPIKNLSKYSKSTGMCNFWILISYLHRHDSHIIICLMSSHSQLLCLISNYFELYKKALSILGNLDLSMSY